jgi:hypothetical protein
MVPCSATDEVRLVHKESNEMAFITVERTADAWRWSGSQLGDGYQSAIDVKFWAQVPPSCSGGSSGEVRRLRGCEPRAR